ncbi:hypothetical protein FB567DRAFT_355229 [Paraphoma chrysanthemicola]|uniref:Uncharacterized protein n=1 Tax=Paraphoma chrysanthemicola TaxID=798071 RepID=A0A8K0R545_9PLEO|nr:hypothetical protein FB567DRAFT_355229 [Paraphoma chrysanthemicola]
MSSPTTTACPVPTSSTLMQKHKNSLWVTSEIKNVENQIAILRLRGAYLQEQSTRLETARFLKRQSERIARAECRAICDAMLRSLPRELRDIIHAYLVDEHSDLEKKRPALITQKGLHNVVPHIGALLSKHFVQSSYVGELFLDELISRFWETATLRIVDPGRTPDGQPSVFRYPDPFGGEALFGQRLRNVVFVLTFVDVDDLKNSSILDGLESLAAVAKNGCQVTLNIDQPESVITTVAVLEYVGSRLRAMKAIGLMVEVRRKGETVRWERACG